MKLLLDTHVWLWGLLAPDRLSAAARADLESAEHDRFLSSISVWETLVLAERGRLRLDPDAPSWIRLQLATNPVRQLAVDVAVAMESRLVKLPHQDPADRFIAATARVHGLTLVTADERLLEAPDGYTVIRAV